MTVITQGDSSDADSDMCTDFTLLDLHLAELHKRRHLLHTTPTALGWLSHEIIQHMIHLENIDQHALH